MFWRRTKWKFISLLFCDFTGSSTIVVSACEMGMLQRRKSRILIFSIMSRFSYCCILGGVLSEIINLGSLVVDCIKCGFSTFNLGYNDIFSVWSTFHLLMIQVLLRLNVTDINLTVMTSFANIGRSRGLCLNGSYFHVSFTGSFIAITVPESLSFPTLTLCLPSLTVG